MDFKGHLDSINKDLTTGEFIIQIRTKENVLAAFQKLKDITDLSIVIKRFGKKRSLTANGYYWVLIGKVADASFARLAFIWTKYLTEQRILCT